MPKRLALESLETRRCLTGPDFTVITIPDVFRPVVADIDGDGLDDIVSYTFGPKLAWHRNLGGHFGNPITIADGLYDLIITADFDNDGDLDVGAASSGFVWVENLDGIGNSWEEHVIEEGFRYITLDAADFDSDGDIDIAFERQEESIYWMENNDGQFDTRARKRIPISQEGVIDYFPVDVDLDGDIDFVGPRGWSENIDGLGTFQSRALTGLDTEGSFSGYVGDTDLDGDNDLVITNFTWKRVTFHENLGGEFAAPQEIRNTLAPEDTMGPPFNLEPWEYYPLLADIDGDGFLDIVTSGHFRRSGEPRSYPIFWYQNDGGSGAFDPTNFVVDEGNFTSDLEPMHAIDVENDGDVDLLVYSRGLGELLLIRNERIGLPGDSNRDGVFNSSDLVFVFQAGEYEDRIAGNSTYEEGDWNGDGEFDSSDLVFAFQAGTYSANAILGTQAAETFDDIFAQLADDARLDRKGKLHATEDLVLKQPQGLELLGAKRRVGLAD